MSFSESIDINVTSHTADAAEDLREVGKAADEAKTAVDDLDKSDIDIAIDDAQLPSVKQELEDIRDAAEKADAQDVTVDVSVPNADTAATSVGHLRDNASGARNAMHNMTGNAAQDLAELGGISGSAGVGIGQLAEAAAEGGANLGAMAAAGGGILGVGIAIQGIRDQLDKLAKIKAWEKERVEEYTQAILDGASAAEALHDKLSDTGKVEFRLFQDVHDITDEVVALGLSVGSFTELASAGIPTIKDWGQAQIDAGADAEQVRNVVLALGQESLRLRDAQAAATVTNDFLHGSFENTSAAVTELERNTQNLRDALAQLPAEKRISILVNSVVPDFFKGLLPSGLGGTTVNNFHAPAPSPAAQEANAREWRRVQEGPGSPS